MIRAPDHADIGDAAADRAERVADAVAGCLRALCIGLIALIALAVAVLVVAHLTR